MNRFSDPVLINGESYAYGLSRVGDTAQTDEFTESTSLDMYINEDGVANFLGKIFSYAGRDPIDCEKVPKFSSDNNFIRGVALALPPGVPVGAFFAYDFQASENREPPPGYVFCDGKRYELPSGKIWVTPTITPPLGQPGTYIQKLPPGAKLTDRSNPFQSIDL